MEKDAGVAKDIGGIVGLIAGKGSEILFSKPALTIAALGTIGTGIALYPQLTKYLTGPVYLRNESKKRGLMRENNILLSKMLNQNQGQMRSASQSTLVTSPLA